MVRGVSRRVIVVKPEQPELFEQAIFLVRDYNAPRGDMVREACRIACADEFIERMPDGYDTYIEQGGALLIGTIWALTALVL